MKFLFCLFVLMLQLTLVSGQQIVLLYGSGSAGKTTLAREILSLNQEWCHIDEDEIFNEMWLEHVSRIYPKEFQIIDEVLPHENLFQALKNSTIIFPEDTTNFQQEVVKTAVDLIQTKIAKNKSDEFRKRLFQNFEMLIIDRVRECLNNGKSIILDRWHTTPDLLFKTISDTPIIKVLVFSTLEHTLEHFQKRNEWANQSRNASSHRLYKHVIPSYVRLYKLSDKPYQSLCSYRRADVENMFRSIRDELPVERSDSKKVLMFGETTKEGLDKLKEEFVPNSSYGNTLYLSPIDHYDFIINVGCSDLKNVALDFPIMISQHKSQ